MFLSVEKRSTLRYLRLCVLGYDGTDTWVTRYLVRVLYAPWEGTISWEVTDVLWCGMEHGTYMVE